MQLVAHGDPAREALWAELEAAQADDPLAPVTVVVPSPYAGLALRRELGARRGLANVDFMGLGRVAEVLAGPLLAAEGRRPLPRALRAEAVYATLVAQPGPFTEVVGHPSTVDRLDATFRDLRRTGIAPEAIARALRDRGPRAAAVARLYEAFRLRTADSYDEEDLLDAAATVLASDPAAGRALGHLVVWLPIELSHAAQRLVRALADTGRSTVVVGLLGDEAVDRAAVASLAPATMAAPDPAGTIRGEAPAGPPHGTHVLVAPDPEDEVRAVVRRIAERVEAGTPLHEIAVLYRLDEPYARLVPELLDGAGLAWNGPSPRRLADCVLARVLLGALVLSETDLARDAVAAWCASGPVVDPATGRPVPAARWDVVSRQAGVVAGVDQWHERLTHRRAELDRALVETRSRDDTPIGLAERLAGDLETVAALDRFVAELAEQLAEPGERSWAALVGWARSFTTRYLGDEHARAAWPEAEREAARRVDAALDGLATLDRLGVEVDVARFRRALARELDVPIGRVQRYGTGVYVGPLRDAYGTRSSVVYVLGMIEGSFPPRGGEDPLLPDRDRRCVPGLALRAERRVAERRDHLAALSAAPEVVLCFPRADPRAQRACLPARWLLETAGALTAASDPSAPRPSAEALLRLRPAPWFESVGSFEDGLRHDRAAASIREHDLRSLAEWSQSGRALHDHPLAAHDGLAAGLRAIEQRASRALTAFDGLVGPEAGLALDATRAVSPTALQDWAHCPFRYFLGRVLHVREVAKPERVDTISALDEGTLVHAVLEEFVRRARPRRGPDDAWDATDHALMGEIVAARCDEAEQRGITGRALQWQLARRRIERVAQRFLRTDDAIRAEHGTVPTEEGLELAFGTPEPLVVRLPDGRGIPVRGRIDRVDRSPDGQRAVVYDYKTSRRFTLGDDPVEAGRRLQLPVYALAARERLGTPTVDTYYWFTRHDADEALTGFRLDDATLDRFVHVAGAIVEGIAGGCFPAFPGDRSYHPGERRETFENCVYCAYDRACAPDRLSTWARKADDAALDPFYALDLEEPDAGVDDVGDAR